MAIIQPSGNFSNLTGGSKSREASKPEQAPGPQESFSFSGVSHPAESTPTRPSALPDETTVHVPIEVPLLDQPHKGIDFNNPVYGGEFGTLNYFHADKLTDNNSDRAVLEFGGALMSGPGVASGIAAIQDIGGTGGVSEFAFTNGLHSTKLVGINGNVLADLSPFK